MKHIKRLVRQAIISLVFMLLCMFFYLMHPEPGYPLWKAMAVFWCAGLILIQMAKGLVMLWQWACTKEEP